MHLIKQEGCGFVELLYRLFQVWVITTGNNNHEVHLSFHFSFCGLDEKALSMFVVVEPANEETVTEHLLFVASFSDIQHYVVVSIEELFYDCNEGQPEFGVEGRLSMLAIRDVERIGSTWNDGEVFLYADAEFYFKIRLEIIVVRFVSPL